MSLGYIYHGYMTRRPSITWHLTIIIEQFDYPLLFEILLPKELNQYDIENGSNIPRKEQINTSKIKEITLKSIIIRYDGII